MNGGFEAYNYYVLSIVLVSQSILKQTNLKFKKKLVLKLRY